MPRLCAFAEQTSLPRTIRGRSRWFVHNAGWWLCRLARKSEYRSSRFETIPNYRNPDDRNQKTPRSVSALPRPVWGLGTFEFRICFGFRDSSFEFIPCLGLSRSPPRGIHPAIALSDQSLLQPLKANGPHLEPMKPQGRRVLEPRPGHDAHHRVSGFQDALRPKLLHRG